MKRIETIKKREDFTKIIKKGLFQKNDIFVIYYLKSSTEGKIGIAITKKIGKAFLRNKIKRQIRSIIDQNKLLFSKEYNYIIMIRDKCKSINFKEKNKKLTELIEKIR